MQRLQEQAKVDFPLPRTFRLRLIAPSIPPESALNDPQSLLAHHGQHSRVLPHANIDCAIPNPSYRQTEPGERPIPRYAAFRLAHRLKSMDRTILRFRVRNLWEARLKSHTRASRGVDFHQWWFGVWCRYAMHSVISSDSIPSKPKNRQLVQLVTSSYDRILGKRPQKALKDLDPPVSKAMSSAHRRSARYLRAICKGEARIPPGKRGKRGEKQKKRHTLKRTQKAMKWYQGNAPYRLGGMGTMLAVSWGEGTDFHRDQRDLGALLGG